MVREPDSMDNHCERFPAGDTGHNGCVKDTCIHQRNVSLVRTKGDVANPWP